MKKGIAVICLALLAAVGAKAQVVITGGMMGQLAQVKVAVVDSTNAEPVPFASVYLTGSKDSTINHFTLTDNKGLADGDVIRLSIPPSGRGGRALLPRFPAPPDRP